jgi:hypothetical protein
MISVGLISAGPKAKAHVVMTPDSGGLITACGRRWPKPRPYRWHTVPDCAVCHRIVFGVSSPQADG